MRDGIAETVAEAQAQPLELPAFKNWRWLAGRMDGYKIAEELRLEFSEWCNKQAKRWQTTQQWELDVLQLRLMLFFAYRADYWTGYDYTEHDDMADSLLRELSEKLNLPYDGRGLDES